MNRIILIDDDHAKGWNEVFGHMFKDVYGDLIKFEVLDPVNNESISKAYLYRPDAIFIQDNNLGEGVVCGLDWIKSYGKTRCIIFHSFATVQDHLLAQFHGAAYNMMKDDPTKPMPVKDFCKMIIDMHKIIITHFKLTPELLWLAIMKMPYYPEEE